MNTVFRSSSAPDNTSSQSSKTIPEKGVGDSKTINVAELELINGAVTPTVFVKVTLIG